MSVRRRALASAALFSGAALAFAAGLWIALTPGPIPELDAPAVFPHATNAEFETPINSVLRIGVNALTDAFPLPPTTTTIAATSLPPGASLSDDRRQLVIAPVSPGTIIATVELRDANGEISGTARARIIVTTDARPLPDPTGRLEIPGVLDAELGRMAVVDGRVSPPDFRRAFLVEGYGEPRDPSSSTVFVVMHSSVSLPAIGSALVHDGQPVVKPGAEIVVDGIQFRATEAFFVAKPDLAGVDRLWDGSADLVILSCRPRPGGAAENLVIVAERVPVDVMRPDAF